MKRNSSRKLFLGSSLVAALIFIWMVVLTIDVLYDGYSNSLALLSITLLLIVSSFAIIVFIYKKYFYKTALILLVPTVLIAIMSLYIGFVGTYCQSKGWETWKLSGKVQWILATEENEKYDSKMEPGKARISPYWAGLWRCEQNFKILIKKWTIILATLKLSSYSGFF